MSQEEIIKANTVDIHGKSYLTVAGRIQLVHEGSPDELTIQTEVLSHDPIVVKATVIIHTDKTERIASGISSVDPKTTKQIEKMSPYEVAETSAVGRALGFLGYGLVDTIASADEIVKATQPVEVVKEPLPWEGKEESVSEELERKTERNADMDEAIDNPDQATESPKCQTCGAPAVFKSGVSKKTGKPYSVYFCSTDDKSHARFV